MLRETAQTPDEDRAAFEDVERHRYFNCNNIWVDLEALERKLDERDGVLGLPMIVNRKTVDPSDSSSPAVVQLETAMGAAIGVFEGARGDPRAARPLRAGQDDQRPARACARTPTSWPTTAASASPRRRPPLVELDSEHYKLLAGFERRFPAGPPSLVGCERLSVEGDVRFGADVTVRGRVTLEGPTEVPAGALLEG